MPQTWPEKSLLMSHYSSSAKTTGQKPTVKTSREMYQLTKKSKLIGISFFHTTPTTHTSRHERVAPSTETNTSRSLPLESKEK